MERIERIKAMEAAFALASTALAEGRYDLPEFRLLSDYMDSGEWLADYEADERGLIPREMKRGVLSQDALYDLLTEWKASSRRKKPVIHLFGASGSGTTTLGRALCEGLGFRHLDTDDYFWMPTDPMFTQKRPIPERIAMMSADMDAAERGVVVSGSLTGWGDVLIPRFTLAVRVVTETDVRRRRLQAREYARFGERICEGGDMHEQHVEFLDWAAQYDTGDVNMRSKACHDAWQQTLPCPVITVNGADALETSVGKILKALSGSNA